MKKIIIALLALMPLACMAQNTWEAPSVDSTQIKAEQAQKAKAEAQKKLENAKYLAGAVPEIDGKVVFTLDRDVPGKTADQIYSAVYGALQALTQEQCEFPNSKISVVNKGEHTIAARYKEWLVFQSSFLSLDRTVFNYTIIAQATDGHIHCTMERISYQYEMDRGDSEGMSVKADDWITDKHALNKKKTKLYKGSGKFRRKTIDRKDNIFGKICKALEIKY
jgi:hypothetical protein